MASIFLSDQIQICFRDLYTTIYNEERDYVSSIVKLTDYMIDDNNSKYDEILKRYSNVTKRLISQMILSNFLEITNYRRNNGVSLDEDRLYIINAAEESKENTDLLFSLLYVNKKQVALMLNDVLFYFGHPSIIYSYNAVKSLDNNIKDVLCHIYPLSAIEHSLTLDIDYCEYKDKDYVLYMLIEIIMNEMDRIMFEKEEYPSPTPSYMQEVSNLIKKDYSDGCMIHRKILDTFKSRLDINDNINYDKIFIIEILSRILELKKITFIPLAEYETTILDKISSTDFTIESLSKLYDENEKTIINILIDSWNYFESQIILIDDGKFHDVKNNYKKYLKKHF